jgi:hypothetical protein
MQGVEMITRETYVGMPIAVDSAFGTLVRLRASAVIHSPRKARFLGSKWCPSCKASIAGRDF